MAWITPKVNWIGRSDENNVYEGDKFNYTDFNRIKGNLEHLHEISKILYPEFTIRQINDKYVTDDLYADEINDITFNLKVINSRTVKLKLSALPTYRENGPTMDYRYLNTVENTTLEIYNNLIGAISNRRMFTWNFGTRGDSL